MKPPDTYIKYLQAHPAVWEALQEEWKPRAGDWYSEKWYEEEQLIGTNRHLTHLIANGVNAWAKWLPTLTDLLGMIEEAGWAWEKRLDGTVEAHREIGYHEEYDQYEYESTGNIYGGGIMRTFAKLAVRVLEGR